MQRILFASAALAVVAAAAPAAADTVGQLDAGYARTELKGEGWDESADTLALSGRVLVPASDLVTFQFDGALTRTELDDYAETVGSAAAHAFTRNDSWAAGGFVALDDSDGEALWSGGVEAQKYFADVTVAGALAYGQFDQTDNVDLWSLDGEVRWFVSDNLRLDAGAGYTRVESGVDGDGWSVGVGAEYQFAGQPFSVYGGYSHARTEDFGDVPADTVSIGLRWAFGTDSLKVRDRKGAGFDGAAFSGLPGIL